jgi:hypothetical protein
MITRRSGFGPLLRAIPARLRHISDGGMIVGASQRIRDATRSEGCTATDYAVNWRPSFPARFGAKRLEQQRDWRILEATIGVLS